MPEIGNQVVIVLNASLNSYGQNDQILIGDRIQIDPNVSIKSAAQNSKIILKDGICLGEGADNNTIELHSGGEAYSMLRN
ncbi:MAG TPA: hypothetical protein V6D14_02955 [Coleofasciculaceae cyanobacterium]|jgi:carbonic anhydrase/acetyltransferase-like protein (isoleucine patch superfamily)